MSCKRPRGRTVVESRASAALFGSAEQPPTAVQNRPFAESDKDKSPRKNSVLKAVVGADARDSGRFRRRGPLNIVEFQDSPGRRKGLNGGALVQGRGRKAEARRRRRVSRRRHPRRHQGAAAIR